MSHGEIGNSNCVDFVLNNRSVLISDLVGSLVGHQLDTKATSA